MKGMFIIIFIVYRPKFSHLEVLYKVSKNILYITDYVHLGLSVSV